MAPLPTGVRRRHSSTCPAEHGGRCKCDPTYEASVYLAADGKKLRRTFPTVAAAKAWRADALAKAQTGALRAPDPTTLRDAAEQTIAGMRSGAVRARGGRPFRGAVIDAYERALRLHVLPDLGARRLADVRRRDVQGLVDRLSRDGLAPSTIRNVLDPLRVVYRVAVRDELVATSPIIGIDLPSGETPRDRVADPDEAAVLLLALPRLDDRALWATALYGGLRRGELRALRWRDVDLGAGVIRVRASMDDAGRVTAPKTKAGEREAPIFGPLLPILTAYRDDDERHPDALVFPGSHAAQPFTPSAVGRRAATAWRRAALDPITLHEARHSAVSMWIAAGLNLKAVSEFAGHASITITLDRYGHLLPSSVDEARAAFDRWFQIASSRARSAG